jgi:hypothetical protein
MILKLTTSLLCKNMQLNLAEFDVGVGIGWEILGEIYSSGFEEIGDDEGELDDTVNTSISEGKKRCSILILMSLLNARQVPLHILTLLN